MKIIIITASMALFGLTAQSAETFKTTCKLKAGSGPFRSFVINGEKLSYKYAKGVSENNNKETVTFRLVQSSETEDREFSFVVSDWASGRIFTTDDDDGKAAFVSMRSDGPSVTGYYRCE
jgi:hypothetical protein